VRHHKFNMKTRNTKPMKYGCMVDRWISNRAGRSLASRALLLAAARLAFAGGVAAGLGACASGPSSSMFVDPAKYELYNCEQLATARTASNNRVVELERLMAKAETGAGGALVSGLAYQTDFLAERARRDQIDEQIAGNNCSSVPPKTPAQPAPPAKRRR
jgi:hypothetical protein